MFIYVILRTLRKKIDFQSSKYSFQEVDRTHIRRRGTLEHKEGNKYYFGSPGVNLEIIFELEGINWTN